MKQQPKQSSNQSTKQQAASAERKPFVTPALTREAGLTEATAERTFTFTTAS